MNSQSLALVTGTSSGIGLHTAVGLARSGLHVIATMRDISKAQQLLATADAARVAVDVRPLDVTEASDAERCIQQVLAEYGRLDVWVNNAGRGSVGTLEQLSLDDLRAQMELNYLGVASLTRLVLPAMRDAGSGRIVTV